MISYYYKTEIEELIAKILSSSSLKGMLMSTIQDRLLNCPVFRELENSRISFLFEKMPEDIFLETFGFDGVIEQINERELWVVKSYFDLFFEYKKTFSYLFTIIPLEMMYSCFDTLHSAGEDRLFSFYERKDREKTLLSRLIKLRGLSISKLSVLTNINYNTVEKYTRDNRYIFSASFENIHKLSKVLDVNPEIFLEKLDIDIKEERYDSSLKELQSNNVFDNAIFYSFLYHENNFAKKSYKHNSENRVFSSSFFQFQIIDLKQEKEVYAKIERTKYNNVIVFDQFGELDITKIVANNDMNIFVINEKSYYKVLFKSTGVQKGPNKAFKFIK